MRSVLLIFLLILNVHAADWQAGEVKDLGTLPGGANVWEQTVRAGTESARISVVLYGARDYDTVVLDNPPSAPRRLAEAAPAAGGVAGCNASYFHADGRPLGLVVIGGDTNHGFERAKLLSGIFASRKNRLELIRASDFVMGDDVRQAVQGGPWLIEGGGVISGLDDTKRARRTVVANDGRGNWAFIATSPVTLAQAAAILALPDLGTGFTIKNALNLDGGSSTALWAKDTALSIPEFGTVRNFLVLKPKLARNPN